MYISILCDVLVVNSLNKILAQKPERCTSQGYPKSPGMCACYYPLEGTDKMAEESQTVCGLNNDRLPEIYSAEQNVAIFAQMVPIYVQVDG